MIEALGVEVEIDVGHEARPLAILVDVPRGGRCRQLVLEGDAALAVAIVVGPHPAERVAVALGRDGGAPVDEEIAPAIDRGRVGEVVGELKVTVVDEVRHRRGGVAGEAGIVDATGRVERARVAGGRDEGRRVGRQPRLEVDLPDREGRGGDEQQAGQSGPTMERHGPALPGQSSFGIGPI